MKIVSTPISPPSQCREIKFGKFAVCSNCGKLAGHNSNGVLSGCCPGSGVMSLKKYVKEVRSEEFKEEDWSFGETKEKQ